MRTMGQGFSSSSKVQCYPEYNSADLARRWPKEQEEVQDTALSNPVGAGAITFFADVHKHLGSIQPRDSTRHSVEMGSPHVKCTDMVILATV